MSQGTPSPGDRPIPHAKVRAPRLRGIERLRLFDRLTQARDRCVLIVAPAGSGKTTLLAQYVGRSGIPAAWYRAEAPDTSETALLAHLGAAVAAATDQVAGADFAWSSVEEASNTLDGLVVGGPADSTRLVIIVDDVHTLAGSPAEAALERLITLLPTGVAMLLAARQAPGFNVSRLRANGLIAELGPDDLRFRHWEVEELFQDYYGDPLLPDDLVVLARRTEGWAAGLQLFHLATQAKPPGERRRMLGVLAGRSRLVSDYLAENVLHGLPPELRRFLLDTCVLGRMTGPLCDEFLSTHRSGEHLAELERRQVFTEELDGAGTFRYHEVLRSYLEATLAHEQGEAALAERYVQAAALLERWGAPADALRAYCRCGDWSAASRLLGLGSTLEGLDEVLEAIPSSVVDADPWLLLAAARHKVAAGAVAAALTGYERAEQVGSIAAVRDICVRERRHLRAWTDPVARPGGAADWLGLILQAMQSDPLGVSITASAMSTKGDQGNGNPGNGNPGDNDPADNDPANDNLAEGNPADDARVLLNFAGATAQALAGSFTDASRQLRIALREGHLSPVLEVVAEVVAAIVATLSTGHVAVEELERAATTAERIAVPWIARVAHMSLALGGRHRREPNGEVEWDEALFQLFSAIGAVLAAAFGPTDTSHGLLLAASESAEAAANTFHRLEVGVLEAWALAYGAVALAQARGTGAEELARRAERLAKTVGARGPLALALWARGDSDAEAAALAQRCGLWLPPSHTSTSPEGALPEPALPSPTLAPPSRSGAAQSATADSVGSTEAPAQIPVRVLCLGRFRLEIDGTPVTLSAIRPRARALLRLLALHTGQPVHRETILEALWPEAACDAGPRNLHVAISSLRQALESRSADGEGISFIRDGDAYVLAVPPGAVVDVLALGHAVAAGRAARAGGDLEWAQTCFREALELYCGEVLSEDGPAEWVLAVRERCRRDSVYAAEALAEIALDGGRHGDAAAAASRGVGIDRYNDALWRLLASAHERNHDHAGAARARQSYADVLDELGLQPV